MHKRLLNISFYLFFSLTAQTQETTKKELYLSIMDTYCKEQNGILNNYPEEIVNALSLGDSLRDYILRFPTVVHEAYHYNSALNNGSNYKQRTYTLDDTLVYKINKFYTFPANELVISLSEKQKSELYLYDLYIKTVDKNQDTQQNGFFGILEEYNAYHYEFQAYNCLFDFLKDSIGMNDTIFWCRYLCEIGSVRNAMDEFELYISWYLIHAEENYPGIYKQINDSESLKSITRYLHNENLKLKSTYEKNRVDILTEFDKVLEIEDGWLVYGNWKSVIHDNQSKSIEKMWTKQLEDTFLQFIQ